MEIELKTVRHYPKMSEETNAFSASLHIDGKPVGDAGNDGKGGPTWYRAAHPDYWPLIQKAEEYCKTLPPFVFGKGTPEQFEVPSDLEGVIDDLFEQHLSELEQKKYRKKMEKDMLTGILYGDDKEYFKISFPIKGTRKSLDIAGMLKESKGREFIKHVISEHKRLMSPRHRILNTNIPKELL